MTLVTNTVEEQPLIGLADLGNAADDALSDTEFDYIYFPSTGATGSVVGQPDLSLMTATEFAKAGGVVVRSTNLPVITSADAGFGGTSSLCRTVQLYEQAGKVAQTKSYRQKRAKVHYTIRICWMCCRRPGATKALREME